MEVLDLACSFLIVFWEKRPEFLHNGSGCHSIVCWGTVDLLATPLELIKFLLEGSALGSEPFNHFLIDSAIMVILLGDAP
jgi:hypothetical protein